MWPWAIAVGIGAALASRRQPKTRVVKRESFGPRTGLVYQTEEFPDAGFLVVHAPDGTTVTFTRHPTGRFVYVRSLGPEQTVMATRADFESPMTPTRGV